MKTKFTLLPASVFSILSVLFYTIHQSNPLFSLTVLMGGNILMALLTLITYFIVKKQVDERPQAFVRGVYSGTFLKMMVCLIAIVIYAMLNRTTLHKPTLFVLFGIYAIYTVLETAVLMKLAKKV
jgi:Ca2+/Na+ antiporter